ncbi:MAG: flagellar export protein FliJ [Usitatibacteraceae bacterium]
MSTHPSLQLVIHVSTDRRNGASLALAGSRRQSDDARKKLEMLCRYREDYLAKLNEGTDVVRIANTRAFIAKLDQAIAQQQRETDACESRSIACVGLVNVEEKKLRSLETLRDRRALETRRAQNRIEQKRTDEFGARVARAGGATFDYRPA